MLHEQKKKKKKKKGSLAGVAGVVYFFFFFLKKKKKKKKKKKTREVTSLTAPVSMSYMRAPRLHQSTALLCPLLIRISGALGWEEEDGGSGGVRTSFHGKYIEAIDRFSDTLIGSRDSLRLTCTLWCHRKCG